MKKVEWSSPQSIPWASKNKPNEHLNVNTYWGIHPQYSALFPITCTELRWQYPLSGNRMTCVESWFQPAFTELHMTSPISGNTSSIRALSPLSVILSPRSGATRTTKHSQGRDTRLRSWSWRQLSNSASMGCSWKYRASSYSRVKSCRRRAQGAHKLVYYVYYLTCAVLYCNFVNS